MNTAEFIQTAYERTGQSTSFTDVDKVMADAHENILQNYNPWSQDVRSIARNTLWHMGDSAVQTHLAITSILGVSGDVNNRQNSHPKLLLFSSPSELALASEATQSEAIAIRSLCTVANICKEHRTDSSIPSSLVPWATTLSTIANAEQLTSIHDVLSVVSFSDTHVDSGENMDDAHPVAHYLFQKPPLAQLTQTILLQAATFDAHATNYKPHIWQAQLNTTLSALASDQDHPLRKNAREQLNVPIDDQAFISYIGRINLERLQVQSIQDQRLAINIAERTRAQTIEQAVLAKQIRSTLGGVLIDT